MLKMVSEVSPVIPVTPGGSRAGEPSVQDVIADASDLPSGALSCVQTDWLHATYSRDGAASVEVLGALGAILRAPLFMRAGPGLMGYTTRCTVMARLHDKQVVIGALCEGEAQRGWNLLQFNSRGCALVAERWVEMHCFLTAIGARITRVDLAVDFLNGENCVDDAVKLYEVGAFNVRGRKPKSSIAGDWHNGIDGRTFYVGRRENGKLLRVYEKGRQLGDLKSPWVRWELQLGRKERDLPLDILINPAPFFAGAYPALHDILPAASISLPTRVIERSTDLVRRLRHLRASYGATLTESLSLSGATAQGVMEALRKPVSHARDPPADGDPTWEAIRSELASRGN